MPSAGGERAPQRRPPEWDRLELAVRRLLDDHQGYRRRARAAEQRVQELEGTLSALTEGRLDPLVLEQRIAALEGENRALQDRLDRARAQLQRMMARLQFLEEER